MKTDGFIVLDKPSGITSTKVVDILKTQLSLKKAGHLGTLDPMATGVLPVAIGEGTKFIPFQPDTDKEYIATMMLGVETDSYDIEGKILIRKEVSLIDKQEIVSVVKDFHGEIELEVPPLSAVKRGGRRLYRMFREGRHITPPKRKVKIKNMEIEEIELPLIRLRILCTQGTYVRSIAHEMGRRLRCGACVSELRRIRSGVFTIDNSIKLMDKFRISAPEKVEKKLMGLREFVQRYMKTFKVEDELTLKNISKGVDLILGEVKEEEKNYDFIQGDAVCVVNKYGFPVAITTGEYLSRGKSQLKLKIRRVIHGGIMGTE